MRIISAGDASVRSHYLSSEVAVCYGLYEFVWNKSQMINREKCLSLMILFPCLASWQKKQKGKCFGAPFKLDHFQTNTEN
jgi:hypothetical protein